MTAVIITGLIAGFIGYIAGRACLGEDKVSVKQASATSLGAYLRGLDFAMKAVDQHGPDAIDIVEEEYREMYQAKLALERN